MGFFLVFFCRLYVFWKEVLFIVLFLIFWNLFIIVKFIIEFMLFNVVEGKEVFLFVYNLF